MASPQTRSTTPATALFWKTLRLQLWEWRGIWVTAPLVTGAILALRLTGLLQVLEWGALDEFFRRRPVEPPDPSIVIVGIGESDLTAIGKYPFTDAVLAKLLQKINQQKPNAIGMDLYRNLPNPPGSAELMQVFRSTPNLIGIEKKVGDATDPPIPPPAELKRLEQVSSNDIVPDTDNKIRRGFLAVMSSAGEFQESLGLQLALFYLEKNRIEPDPNAPNLKLGQTSFVPFQANDGGYVQADSGGEQILINYRGPARTFRTISVTDVLQNRIPPDFLRDRIVLIGATAPSLNDLFYTPFSSGWTGTPERMPGVEIQANVASQIIQSATTGRSLIQVWEDSLEGVWILLWAGAGATIGWVLRTTRWTIVGLLLAAVGLVGICFLAFLAGWWIPVIPPALALLGSMTVMTRYIAILERQDRNTIMNLFGRHVTQEVAEAIWRDRDQILKEGHVRGQRITATVLFSDIKDFSTIAEHMEPEVLMVWLNEYMGEMAQLVLEHGGIVDKFIGDAVMAVFGVPIPRTTDTEIAHDAQQAVRCALAMGERLKSLNERWQAQARPLINIRVGICTGTVVIGSLGSAQRLDYTTIGDSVNIAARLESYDKSIDGGMCRILISESTYLLSQNNYAAKAIGSVVLKGREQLSTIYQVFPAGE